MSRKGWRDAGCERRRASWGKRKLDPLFREVGGEVGAALTEEAANAEERWVVCNNGRGMGNWLGGCKREMGYGCEREERNETNRGGGLERTPGYGNFESEKQPREAPDFPDVPGGGSIRPVPNTLSARFNTPPMMSHVGRHLDYFQITLSAFGFRFTDSEANDGYMYGKAL
ncbi:hypothetical protein BDK51DRAFT_34652 [Blyttiomyces helicus]|uniref:Uncharacterized protein n=1 Tax=Blyttiomyces helicus TaxID=388810 RepID=A0A4P9W2Y5_9FUNG|nr:hypothetical protein BDK51DRAFT_34652 [Blyttiomyces helicus]|eukprot:RKO86122.1 hypothetical protein BDK51DRAFT_34652 [Blyttiomyces helicus]